MRSWGIYCPLLTTLRALAHKGSLRLELTGVYTIYGLIEQGVGVNALKDQHLFQQVAAHRQVFFAQT